MIRLLHCLLLALLLPLPACSADSAGRQSRFTAETAADTSDAAADTAALHTWEAGAVVEAAAVAAYGEERCFRAEPLSDAVFARMQGKSYRPNPYIRRSDLRYVRALHYDPSGQIRLGELVCHRRIAADLVSIFHELYRHRYVIGRMVLVDNYGADDEKSMADNNTSCFNYRVVPGSKRLSLHAQGRAIDVNPLFNPYVRYVGGKRVVSPAAGAQYANRRADIPCKIDHADLCYRLFRQHGFTWGGDWRTTKDYQHFQK